MKFLGNADTSWNPGDPRLFTYDAVLAAWIALSVACGLYLLGTFRMPHDSPVDHIGVVRMLFASLFFGLAVYMVPAMQRKTPQGVVGEQLVAFLPRDFSTSAPGSGTPENGHLAWHLDYIDAWKEAVKDSKLIFIDFTGVTCVNCQKNEATVFPRPEVRRELEKYARFQAFTDTVPDPKLNAQGQAERNTRWRDKIGDPTNPYYVILRPNREQPFDKDGNLNGEVLGREKGTIYNVPNFVQFLQKPQQAENQVTMAR
jgi:thiol:disulfide interchange protein DsbD